MGYQGIEGKHITPIQIHTTIIFNNLFHFILCIIITKLFAFHSKHPWTKSGNKRSTTEVDVKETEHPTKTVNLFKFRFYSIPHMQTERRDPANKREHVLSTHTIYVYCVEEKRKGSKGFLILSPTSSNKKFYSIAFVNVFWIY